mgnify:FL=1
MDCKEFKKWRDKLNKTQKEIAQLLGVSVKAVHSYEQGWRNIPTDVERQMFFLLSRLDENPKGRKPCWVVKNCPPKVKELCPAWEFNAGDLCWFVSRTICCSDDRRDWEEKIKFCRSCEVLKSFL